MARNTHDGRVMLIDYRHTGFGPRVLDFAALEASVRLSVPVPGLLPSDIVQEHRAEAEVWSVTWLRGHSGNLANASYSYWPQVSLDLATHARRCFPDLTAAEYAATCLRWSLRIFLVRQLEEVQRLRLLLWMSQLAKAIRGL